jgi:hypothetical protein
MRKRRGIDHLARGFGERAVEADDVRRTEDLFEFGPAAGPPGINDLHTEGLADAPGGAADAPGADNPEREAGQLDEGTLPVAPVGTLRPVPGAHTLGMPAAVLAQLEQEGEHVLRHRGGAIGGDVRHRNAAGAGRDHVDDVVSGGQDTHVAQFRELREHIRAERRLVGQ